MRSVTRAAAAAASDGVAARRRRAGNSTRYRVLVGKNDTAGEYFTLEVLMRAQAYGAVRGA